MYSRLAYLFLQTCLITIGVASLLICSFSFDLAIDRGITGIGLANAFLGFLWGCLGFISLFRAKRLHRENR